VKTPCLNVEVQNVSDSNEHWSNLHDRANADGESHYLDPSTGFQVFTEFGLKARGRCCGSGCRHCPWHHQQVPVARRASVIKQPAWLTETEPENKPTDILFWSGGKDSFLAYRALCREQAFPAALLTTFDANSRVIAHQEIHIDKVVEQATALGVPLLGVPLHSEIAYEEQIAAALALVPAISRLVFGDLHLEHIRTWREGTFAPYADLRNASLHFPLWQVPYETLLTDLEASGAVVTIAATTEAANGRIRVGQAYTPELASSLEGHIDVMGENGEFHSLVHL